MGVHSVQAVYNGDANNPAQETLPFTQTINQGATASLTVDLTPGTYAIVCTVPGHDLLGMKGTVTVH